MFVCIVRVCVVRVCVVRVCIVRVWMYTCEVRAVCIVLVCASVKYAVCLDILKTSNKD